jgi:hypothetical protein
VFLIGKPLGADFGGLAEKGMHYLLTVLKRWDYRLDAQFGTLTFVSVFKCWPVMAEAVLWFDSRF